MKNYIQRRAIISRDEAEALLKPYLHLLREDFQAAWSWVQEILEGDAERRATFDVSTQAAMIFNRFVRLTWQRFDGNPDIKLKNSGRMMKMLISGKLSLRFKKLDDQLRSKNVHTNQQLRMYFQLRFDGMESATEITFGYKTDATGRNVVGVYVTCPVGWGVNKWVIVVDEQDDRETLSFGLTPTDPTPPVDTGIRITPKDVKKTEGK